MAGAPAEAGTAPSDEFHAWVATCGCGWVSERILRWPRDAGQPASEGWATSEDGEPSKSVFEALASKWALHAVEQAAKNVAQAKFVLDRSVLWAREGGQTWERIGSAAGMTRQAAQSRWRATIAAEAPDSALTE